MQPTMELHLHFPAVTTLDLDNWLDAFQLLDAIYRNTERLIKMSGTLAEQLATAQAETVAKLEAIGTDVTEISADVDSLLAALTPGTTITQEMVDAATSIRDRVSTIKDGLDEVNAKVPAQPAP